MQCPYVILKTFRACTTEHLPLRSPADPSAGPRRPTLCCVELVFIGNAARMCVCLLSHVLLPLSARVARVQRFVPFVTCLHTAVDAHKTETCCVFMASDFDKVTSNSQREIEFVVTGSCQGPGCRAQSRAPQKPCAHKLLFSAGSLPLRSR